MSLRVIARLDVKPPYLVKPVHFECLRKLGEPAIFAKKYYQDGADEIFYVDIVASLYRRDILLDKIKQVCEGVFVPFSAGGGIRSIDDMSKLFHAGADKVLINTYALQENPSIIDEGAKLFGSQAITVHIEGKRQDDGQYECYSDCGRVRSKKDVFTWAKEIENRGAGEILVSSIDHDGRQRGYNLDLVGKICSDSNIPIIASSGGGSLEDIVQLVKETNPSGVAIASLLHYEKTTIKEVKKRLLSENIEVSL